MTRIRGRAGFPVRPGNIVKRVLSGQIPLEIGTAQQLVNLASVNDLHATYKEHIKRENARRERVKKLKGMTYFSFCTWFKFARYLGLVEFVRDEELQLVSEYSKLYRIAKIIDKNGKVEYIAQKSTRRLYRLSALGYTEERMWQDCTSAWKDQWAPGLPPKEEVIERVAITPIILGKVPDPDELSDLRDHLIELKTYPKESLDVRNELLSIITIIQGWIIVTEEQLEPAYENEQEDLIEFLNVWRDGLISVMESLHDEEIGKAVTKIGHLITDLEKLEKKLY